MSFHASSQTGWKRTLVFVWGGEFVSILTSSVLQMALIWYVTLITQSASALALVTLAAFVPMAVLGPFAGTIVDRVSIKPSLIAADLFVAAVSLALVVLSLAGALSVEAVIVVALLRAVGTAFHTPAFNALTPFVAPPEMLTKLAGVSQFMQSGGYIAGTAIAAVLYPLVGIPVMVALDVIGALVATGAVVVSRIDTSAAKATDVAVGQESPGQALSTSSECQDSQRQRSMVGEFFRESVEGFYELRRHRGLFAMLWIGFAFTVAFSPVSALFPLMTLGHFGGTTADAALAEIVFSVGMIATSAAIAMTGGFRNRAFSCALAVVLFGVVTLVAGLLPSEMFAAFLVMSCAMGLCTPLYSAPQTALMQERIAPQCLGRVFGLYGAVCSWAMPFGLIVTAVFADGVGVTTFFVMAGVAMIVLGGITWALPSVRHIESDDQSQPLG